MLERGLQADFSPEKLGELSAYVAEVVAAIRNGSEVGEDDLSNLQAIIDFLSTLELAGVGENVTAGIGEGMTAAGWGDPAESVASNLESALNAALQSHSPSERMKPVGENAAAGVGAGLTEYDISADAVTLAGNVETAVSAALTGDALSAIGAGAALGLASAMSAFSMTGTGSAVAANVKGAVSGSLTNATLFSVGLNAMAGLRAGIVSGRGGVVAAMRAAARAAVNAAKAELKIASPSGVFRDEIGRMTMKGFGRGVLLESKAQARTIRNASRYLTGEAKAGAVAYSSNDNRRTYNHHSSVAVNVDSLHVQDRQDLHGLALEIAHLAKRQLAGTGVRV